MTLASPFIVHKIEVRGQKIFADDIVLELTGARYPADLYSKQSLRTLKTHLRNFMIIDYDLKMLTLGLDFYPSSLISMINWQVGTYVERRAEDVVTLRFNSVSTLRDAYYLIEEVFSGLEEHVLLALVKGNLYLFGEGIVKTERGGVSFASNPLIEVIDYIAFERKPIKTDVRIPPPIPLHREIGDAPLSNRLFYGIILAKMLANRVVLANHFNAEAYVTFKNVDDEKFSKLMETFASFKRTYNGTSEENAYPIFSELIKEVKKVLYPTTEIDRLIQRVEEIIALLRKKSGRA